MRAWAEIDLDIIAANYDAVKRKVGDVEIIGVVKSDAYGFGIEQVSRVLNEKNISMLAVISLEEARLARKNTNRPILILGYLDNREILAAIEEGYVLSLYDKELAPLYERLATRLNKQVEVHLKVETGLNRLGLSIDEAADILVSARLFPNVKISAIYSHLYRSNDRKSNFEQLHKLQELILKVQDKAPLLPVHFVNSGALNDFSEGYFDAVRLGLALYGVNDDLLEGGQSCLRVKALVMQVKELRAGDGVSYDHQFKATQDMKVAVVTMGYGEGFPLTVGDRAQVLINGQRAKVIGKVCMNFLLVDATNIPAKRGDEVVIIGEQVGLDGNRDTITVGELAKWALTSHHEIITRLGSILPRIYYGER